MTLAEQGSLGARSEDVRRRNLSALLRYVHVHGPTARSQLTSVLGLNRSTIGGLTGELAATGLVSEQAGRTGRVGTGGRPSHVVAPRTEQVQVLAVDIGVTHLTIARVGLGGVVLARRDRAYGRGTRRQRDMIATIATTVARMRTDLDPRAVVVAAGVAIPGVVRRADGQVRQAPNLGWRDAPLGDRLAEALDLPVAVGNDADLGIRAEHVRGAAAGLDDAVYLSGHSGIGAGIITGGRPLGGRSGYAGEVGHLVVDPDGHRCHCGSRGCWETECGEERLFELAGHPPGGGLAGVNGVVRAAADGDDRAAAALQHVAGWLGKGAANVVNLLNPEVVILGGSFEVVFAAAGEIVQAAFAAAALSAPAEQVRLVTPHLGADSSLVGAAELAFDALLSDPLLELSRRTAS